MNTAVMEWFPPAPDAGPMSMLELPPDDWALEPKFDGIRFIWQNGKLFNRKGEPLTIGKGASKLAVMLQDFNVTIDGEWMAYANKGSGNFMAFDLPDSPADYDGRHKILTCILPDNTVPNYTVGHFKQIYHLLKGACEGVVLKRRRSLYNKKPKPGVTDRDWLKRRFSWDKI